MKRSSCSSRFSLPCMSARAGRALLLGWLVFTPGRACAGVVINNCTEANLRAAVSAGGQVTLACDGTIVLTSPLVVSNDVALDAGGHNVTLSGGGAVRIFTVRPGVTLYLSHLTLADGLAQGTNGVPAVATSGGAGGAGEGGAIFNESGTVRVSDCAFIRNRARGGKGGLSTSIPFAGGRGGHGLGGAVFSAGGILLISNTTFAWNDVAGGNGGDAPMPGSGGGGSGWGGAVFVTNVQASFVGCLFASNNVAPGNPGNPLRASSSGDAYGGAIHQFSGAIEMKACRFLANSAGGGLAIVTRNAARATGGAVSSENGTLRASESLFSGNTARAGAGMPMGSGGLGPDAKGGGLSVTGGEARLTNTTFQANLAVGATAGSGSGGIFAGMGGAGLGGAVFSAANLSLFNCTVAQNIAQGGDALIGQIPNGQAGRAQGGGVCSFSGSATLTHATLAGNAAAGSQIGTTPGPSQGGGVYSSNSTVTLLNTILAGSPTGSNAHGALVDGGHNLSSDASCNFTAPGSLNNTDPLLGPAADYGGPTPTMALLAGSPAIDAGGASGCAATDQRGVSRPFGAACDIGAFESAAPYTVIGQITGYVPPAGSASVGDGAATAAVDAAGGYALHGLAPGPHTLKPESSLAVFVPKTRLVSVVADTVGIDFPAYRTNAIVIRSTPPRAFQAIYAGESGVSYNVQSSPALPGTWGLHSTLTTDAEGLLRWSGTNLNGMEFFRVERP